MATRAETLAELQAELVTVKAAISAAMTSGMKSGSINGMSYTRMDMSDLRERRRELEKSIQRLLNGGRSILIDMSCGPYGSSVATSSTEAQ